MKTKLLTLILAVFGLTANAQLYYNFGATTYNGDATSGVPTGWVASPVTVGNTDKTASFFSNTSPSNNNSANYPTFSAAGNVTMFSKAGAEEIADLSYFEVTITPGASQYVVITNISFGSRSIGSSGGPAGFIIRSSVDAFAANAFNRSINTASLWSFYSNAVSISGAQGAAVTLRIYASNSAGSTNTNNWRMDDLTVTFDQTLPVTLTSFTGKPTTSGPQLVWQTASEQNNSHFEILRSSNNADFKAVGTVSGSNTTTTAKSYSFLDSKAAAGVNYYQLKQVDNDGNFKVYPTVVAVKADLAQSEFTAVSTTEGIEVTVNATTAGKGSIKIYSVGGQVVASKEVNFTEGYNKFTFATNNMANGVYIANVNIGTQKLSKKFIK